MSEQPSDQARYGDFPFALTDGPSESRFLTWLRNHSNYMAVGGFLDYLRIAAVLARGIFINTLMLLPPLLVAAVVLSAAYYWMLSHYLTPWALVLAVGWILIFPIATMFGRIAGYQKSLASGSDSSVESRDYYERTFALALLLVLGVAVLDLLPRLVASYQWVRDHYKITELPWKTYLAAATAALASLSAAPKLLKVLSGTWQKLAVAVIAIGGVLAPLLVIVVVTDYLLFGAKPDPNDTNSGYLALLLVFTPLVYVLGILSVMVFGFFKRTFSGRDYLRLSVLAVCIVVLHVAVIAFLYWAYWEVHKHYANESKFVAQMSASLFLLACAFEVWFFGWLTVDINQTSMHALYRDRLASAFLLGVNARGEVGIEEDVPLSELSHHETGSTAPYHLINVALNLQGSDDIGLRDRHSDFFIFSKKFIGGERTGYCRTASMEQVCPQVNLASAMAISAAAASPNMGRSTSPALVAFMTMINVRLGVWVPNPGLLEDDLARHVETRTATGGRLRQRPGFDFAEVFADELQSVEKRWRQLDDRGAGRGLANIAAPTTAHGLAGIAFSGGGIRSATINLGIAQALHRAGLFRHFDYMSTVSGGGYLGSSISAVMRFKTLPVSEIDGRATVESGDGGHKVVTIAGAVGETRTYRYSPDAERLVRNGDVVQPGTRLIRRPGRRVRSEIGGAVRVVTSDDGSGRQTVTVSGGGDQRVYHYTRYDDLAVENGQEIKPHQQLVKLKNAFGDRFRWQVPPQVLLREMTMRLDEKRNFVNLSDGGHIENLATIELLRRRCKLIVIGDGECDPEMHFVGLATLLRTARIDLGIHIDINLDELRLNADQCSAAHLVVGQITYPGQKEEGYLLYLKSTCTGDEDEVIGEYRHRSPTFPHETTADQFFTEGQFEAYRALGQHIGQCAVEAIAPSRRSSGAIGYAEFAEGLAALCARKHAERAPQQARSSGADRNRVGE
ncbi:MAG: hypothetical protein JSS04_12875 [Proteobacteria bacterium]|nr:hypothetical protein [Pseudomonadota bacterium]